MWSGAIASRLSSGISLPGLQLESMKDSADTRRLCADLRSGCYYYVATDRTDSISQTRRPRSKYSRYVRPRWLARRYGPPAPQNQAGLNMTGADVMRVLRANLWLIVISVIAFAIGGYFFNNKFLAKYHSRYTAKGLLQVFGTDEIPFPGRLQAPANPAEIQLVQSTQAQRLMHERNFMETIQNVDSPMRGTTWFKQFAGIKGEDQISLAKEDLAGNFSANPLDGTRLIEVKMTFAVPEDCKVIIEDLVSNHIEAVKDNQRANRADKDRAALAAEGHLSKTRLNEDVLKKLAEKELSLGGSEVGTFQNWNGNSFSSAGSSKSGCAS